MHLLQIRSVPLKYELNIEHARLEYKQNFIPNAEVETKPAELQFSSRRGELHLDTYEARRSVGIERIGDRIRANADRGAKAIQEKTREVVEMGKQMADIENGTTIGQIIKQKMIGDQPSLYTAFLPSGGVDISWVPNKLDTEYQKGQMNYDWKIMRNALNYVPGSVRLNILEYPHVDIEYLGGPIYIPPSAAPDYEAPN